MDGGLSGIKPAADEIQKICDTVQSEVEDETNKTYSEFKATEYRQQIVEGVFYLIKVHVGGSDFLHIYVFQSPHLEDKVEIILKRVEQHKDEDPLDPIRPYH
ncbi:leukocyte cysteine proteinase inhibitor 1-like [Nematolebias whitei]|uniref:leukocyte cysteine proteinase inhibitor 1-like n=1 Tax=Nematolebias whitei TaxID=451745 RepID=UPI001898DD4B|nr:leukocyte cysteine proteinase inhibitor 1-like [Nematolebias whitei]